MSACRFAVGDITESSEMARRLTPREFCPLPQFDPWWRTALFSGERIAAIDALAVSRYTIRSVVFVLLI